MKSADGVGASDRAHPVELHLPLPPLLMSYFLDDKTDQPRVGRIIGHVIGGIVCVILLGMALGSFRIIGAGERGIVLNWGAYNGVILDPGLHWKTPFKTRIIKMDVQTQKGETEADAASKDLNNVKANVAVNFHPDPAKIGDLYKNVGTEYVERIISPAIQEAVKAATAKYTAEELVTKREIVKGDVVTMLSTRLQKYNLILDEVSITNFDFSASFNESIEKKVQAEQDALTSKNKLEQVKYEAQQQIETAKAQAETIRIQASAINAQGGADYVNLKAIEKWDGKLPTQMIPGSAVPFINLNQ